MRLFSGTHRVFRTDHTGRGIEMYAADSLEDAFEAVAPIREGNPGGTLNPRPTFYIASGRPDGSFRYTWV
jgi:hypothetical protein